MKTKIVATYGPSLHAANVLSRAMKYVDVFRINFSHASENDAMGAIENIRKISKKEKKEVAILADLPGPKMRFGRLEGDVSLNKGEAVRLKYKSKESGIVPLDYDIYSYLRKGSMIIIGDGYMRLYVQDLSKGVIYCRAMEAGSIKSRKGINIMHGKVTAVPPTEEDIRIARFAKKNDIDFMALSFVNSAKDVYRFRRIIGEANVISKIERADAVKNIAEIIDASDVIMVARGDLAYEVPIERIPVVQSQLIREARIRSKPVIVATQMLASMVSNPIPTRAEVSDIATAVISGADCVMLSEESAVGKYPIESLSTLATTAHNAESIASRHHDFKIRSINESIAFAAAEISDNYKTDCIFVPTQSGESAIRLSLLRPNSQIIALSQFANVRRKLSMYYGIRSEGIGRYNTADQMFEMVKAIAKRRALRKYIVVSGYPNQKGSTNTLRYID